MKVLLKPTDLLLPQRNAEVPHDPEPSNPVASSQALIAIERPIVSTLNQDKTGSLSGATRNALFYTPSELARWARFLYFKRRFIKELSDEMKQAASNNEVPKVIKAYASLIETATSHLCALAFVGNELDVLVSLDPMSLSLTVRRKTDSMTPFDRCLVIAEQQGWDIQLISKKAGFVSEINPLTQKKQAVETALDATQTALAEAKDTAAREAHQAEVTALCAQRDEVEAQLAEANTAKEELKHTIQHHEPFNTAELYEVLQEFETCLALVNLRELGLSLHPDRYTYLNQNYSPKFKREEFSKANAAGKRAVYVTELLTAMNKLGEFHSKIKAHYVALTTLYEMIQETHPEHLIQMQKERTEIDARCQPRVKILREAQTLEWAALYEADPWVQATYRHYRFERFVQPEVLAVIDTYGSIGEQVREFEEIRRKLRAEYPNDEQKAALTQKLDEQEKALQEKYDQKHENDTCNRVQAILAQHTQGPDADLYAYFKLALAHDPHIGIDTRLEHRPTGQESSDYMDKYKKIIEDEQRVVPINYYLGLFFKRVLEPTVTCAVKAFDLYQSTASYFTR